MRDDFFGYFFFKKKPLKGLLHFSKWITKGVEYHLGLYEDPQIIYG